MDRPQTDVKLAILALWEGWASDPSSASYKQMQKFYQWLEREHPDHIKELRDWLPPGCAPWQEVRAMVSDRRGKK